MRYRLFGQVSTRSTAIAVFSILFSGTLSVAAKFPGETLGSKVLQRDTENQVVLMDKTMAPECHARKVVKTEVIKRAAASSSAGGGSAGPWQERWYVDRCGAVVAWDVHYTPSQRGGTDIHIGPAAQDEGASAAPSGVNADLLAAAESGNGAQIEELLGKGADIETRNEHDLTPLMVASMKGQAVAVELLLKKGSDFKFSNKNGTTALHLAAINGRDEVIKVLLAHGADVNMKPSGSGLGRALQGETPLFDAALFGHVETTKLLIESGADVNAKNGIGMTPLMNAGGNGAVIMLLLQSGADAGARTEDGKLALAFPGENCLSPEAARALIERSRPKKEDLNVALISAVAELDHACIPFIETLLANGAEVDCHDRYGNTPLILAARWGHREMVESLLSRGADVTLKNGEGKTARDVASTREIGNLLKAAGKRN